MRAGDSAEPPGVDAGEIAEYVGEVYGVAARQVVLLSVLSDGELTAYRIEAADGQYFLKLRRDAPPPPLARYLADAGIAGVLAPLKPRAGAMATRIGDRSAVLYPFMEGENAFRRPLSEQQWTTLGALVRAVHETRLPPSIAAALRHETYPDTWRAAVRDLLAALPALRPHHGVAAEMDRFLSARQAEIRALVDHADTLAASLRRRRAPMVPCHGDLHAGNVLVGDDGSLLIVDWDDPVVAPRERDLMFIGAGIGGAWNRREEADAFYRGYGAVAVDAEALAYYRCERFVEDVAVFSERLLQDVDDGDGERAASLGKFISAFGPNDVVEIAERTFAALDS